MEQSTGSINTPYGYTCNVVLVSNPEHSVSDMYLHGAKLQVATCGVDSFCNG